MKLGRHIIANTKPNNKERQQTVYKQNGKKTSIQSSTKIRAVFKHT